MSTQRPLRSNSFLWYMRIVQAVAATIVLAITGSNASNWHSWKCSLPSRLSYNIVCASITLPVIIYLITSSGPKTSTHLLPWNRWAQLAIDGVFFTLWLATTITSPYNCPNLCHACVAVDQGNGYSVWAGKLFCSCFVNGDIHHKSKRTLDARDVLTVLEGRATSAGTGGSARVRVGKTGVSIAVKQTFDAVMIFLFAITLVMTAWRIFKANKARKAAIHSNSTVLEAADYSAASARAKELTKPAPALTKQDLS
jgi:hypothetical protein